MNYFKIFYGVGTLIEWDGDDLENLEQCSKHRARSIQIQTVLPEALVQ